MEKLRAFQRSAPGKTVRRKRQICHLMNMTECCFQWHVVNDFDSAEIPLKHIHPQINFFNCFNRFTTLIALRPWSDECWSLSLSFVLPMILENFSFQTANNSSSIKELYSNLYINSNAIISILNEKKGLLHHFYIRSLRKINAMIFSPLKYFAIFSIDCLLIFRGSSVNLNA